MPVDARSITVGNSAVTITLSTFMQAILRGESGEQWQEHVQSAIEETLRMAAVPREQWQAKLDYLAGS